MTQYFEAQFHCCSSVMIWRNPLSNLGDYLASLLDAFSLKIVTFRLRGAKDNDLLGVSSGRTFVPQHTLKFVGCRRVTLQPITLLKCTVVVLPCPSNMVLPVLEGIICRYSPSMPMTRSFIATNLMGCFLHTVYFLIKFALRAGSCLIASRARGCNDPRCGFFIL